MRWRWLPVLAPASLGVIIGLIINSTDLPNPTFFLRAQLSALSVLFGFILSILVGVGLGVIDWVERTRLRTTLQANQDRLRFLRRLDHELKNPLTAILAGLANLSTFTTDEATRETINSVQAQVHRLRRLVAELRKLSDLETRPLERTQVQIGELLQEVYNLTLDRPEAEARELTISIPQAPWPLPEIAGDRDLLFLAIHNLLDNALKFTQPGDTMEIRAFEDRAQVVVEVADTGPGISSEEIEHVWEELYRGEGARGIPGSGLGLALVRAIVQRHGGDVELRSRSGQGTQFTLRLPIGDVTKL